MSETTPVSDSLGRYFLFKMVSILAFYNFLAPVVQTLDSAIQWINIYPVDSAIGFPNTYPLDSDLSDG